MDTWWDALTAWVTLAALGVAIFVAFHSARVQRSEASKERQSKALADLSRAAFNQVRQSHRSPAKMRDHASEFVIALNTWIVELRPQDREFAEEMQKWRLLLYDEANELSERNWWFRHGAEPILELARRNNEFVGLISQWMLLTKDEDAEAKLRMREVVRELRFRRQQLWPGRDPWLRLPLP